MIEIYRNVINEHEEGYARSRSKISTGGLQTMGLNPEPLGWPGSPSVCIPVYTSVERGGQCVCLIYCPSHGRLAPELLTLLDDSAHPLPVAPCPSTSLSLSLSLSLAHSLSVSISVFHSISLPPGFRITVFNLRYCSGALFPPMYF